MVGGRYCESVTKRFKLQEVGRLDFNETALKEFGTLKLRRRVNMIILFFQIYPFLYNFGKTALKEFRTIKSRRGLKMFESF